MATPNFRRTLNTGGFKRSYGTHAFTDDFTIQDVRSGIYFKGKSIWLSMDRNSQAVYRHYLGNSSDKNWGKRLRRRYVQTGLSELRSSKKDSVVRIQRKFRLSSKFANRWTKVFDKRKWAFWRMTARDFLWMYITTGRKWIKPPKKNPFEKGYSIIQVGKGPRSTAYAGPLRARAAIDPRTGKGVFSKGGKMKRGGGYENNNNLVVNKPHPNAMLASRGLLAPARMRAHDEMVKYFLYYSKRAITRTNMKMRKVFEKEFEKEFYKGATKRKTSGIIKI